MEKILAELLSTVAAPLVEALKQNTEILERVVAGQEAALAKLEGGTGGAAPRTRRTKATETAPADAGTPSTSTPAAAEEPVTPTKEADLVPDTHPLLTAPNSETVKVKNAKAGGDEDTPTANYRAADFSREQVKNEFIGWLGETDNADVRKERGAFVASVGQHFGVKQVFHPTDGLTDDEQRKQTLFFLRRKRAGLSVDFSADYDFDGDPLADVATDDADPLG